MAFRLTCAVAAAVFAGLTVLQVRRLPPTPAAEPGHQSGTGGWRAVATNRRFLAFAAAMAGSYALSFQVYLALPLRVRAAVADPAAATAITGGLFAVSAVVTIAAQVRLTDWCAHRWPAGRCLTAGLAVMTIAFAPMALLGRAAPPIATVLAAALAAALLALGSAAAYPFEMDSIVAMSGGQLVATHYGLYHTVAGLGILAGNTGIGQLMDTGGGGPWLALLAVGAAATLAVHLLDRAGHLASAPPTAPAVLTSRPR